MQRLIASSRIKIRVLTGKVINKVRSLAIDCWTMTLPSSSRKLVAIFTMACAFAPIVRAADLVDGFLCCNAYSDGQVISDLNAPGAERHRVPLGSPIDVTKIGKRKVKLDIENKKQELANDYSRAISMDEFLRRFVVQEDPLIKAKTFPKKVQLAIADERLVRNAVDSPGGWGGILEAFRVCAES